MSRYKTYTNADLRRLLKQCNLRTTGKKAELVARLTAYDYDHPFRFLNLPGEIRNEIYKYVAASEHTPKKGKTKPTVKTQGVPDNNDGKNRAALLQPALFRTCSQIRSESRVFFYRYHTFQLHVWQEDIGLPSRIAEQLRLWRPRTCLDRVKGWLDFLGKDTRKQIRTIEIKLHCDDLTTVKTYAGFIDDVHARLSDEATVVYRTVSQAQGFAMLFELGRIFQAQNPARVLHFEHPNWSLENNTNVWASTLHNFVYTRTRYRVPGPSLTFGPRLGWFGRKGRAGSA